MEKTKKPIYKRWWFWLLIFFFFVALTNLNAQKNKKTGSAPDSAPVTETTTQEEPKEEKDPITAIIDEEGFSYSDLDIIQNGGLVKISLHFDDTSWDETSFCRECLSDYVNICSKAYQIEGIETVEYYVFVDLMDAKGNESKAKGFSMCMPKSTYTTYNWENIKYNPGSYKQIEADSEIYIHPGIKQAVDFSKMYYKG